MKARKVSNYIRGRRVEYYVRELLKKKFDLVLRTAGSHSPFDLVAIDFKSREIWFIQVKANRKAIKKKELEQLKSLELAFRDLTIKGVELSVKLIFKEHGMYKVFSPFQLVGKS